MRKQTLQSLKPGDYKVRIIVAGSRGYNNKKEFHEILTEYVERFNEDILFISGKAKTGADDLIIQWCKKFNYPCLEMPANWEEYQKSAGYIRNTAMSEIATHCILFRTPTSPGSKHMHDIAIDKHLIVKDVIIEIHK